MSGAGEDQDDGSPDEGDEARPRRSSRYTPPFADVVLASLLASPVIIGLTAGFTAGALALLPGDQSDDTKGMVLLAALLVALLVGVALMHLMLVLMPRLRRRYQLEDHLAEVDRKVADLARIDDRLQEAFDKVDAIERRASTAEETDTAGKADVARRSVGRSLRDILAGEADQELTQHFQRLSAYYDRRARSAQVVAVAALLVGSTVTLTLLLVAPPADGPIEGWAPNLVLKAGITVPAGVLFLHFSRLMRRMEYLSSWTALVSVQLSTLYPYGQSLTVEGRDALRSQLGAHVFSDPRGILDGGAGIEAAPVPGADGPATEPPA